MFIDTLFIVRCLSLILNLSIFWSSFTELTENRGGLIENLANFYEVYLELCLLIGCFFGYGAVI